MKNEPRKFVLYLLITFTYLVVLFFVSSAIAFIISIMLSGYVTVSPLMIALVYAGYYILDFGMVYLKRVSPSIIIIVAIASAIFGVIKLFDDDLSDPINKQTITKISNYIFLKKIYSI